jgi:hypothetical protein
MLDPLAQQVGIGGAVAIILVGTVLKFLPSFLTAFKSQKNGNGTRSAGRTAEEWDARIVEAAKKALMETKAQRHEDLRELIKDTLDREFIERNEKLKSMMKEVIGEWLDGRMSKRIRRSNR